MDQYCKMSTEEPTIHTTIVIRCSQLLRKLVNEMRIVIFLNIRKTSSISNKSVESKNIEKVVQEEVCQQVQVLGAVILIEH